MAYQKEEIEALVRQVVTRTLGRMGQRRSSAIILDAQQIEELPAGSVYHVPAGTLVTPLARQTALERHIRLVEESVAGETAVSSTPSPTFTASGKQVIAIGADHGGYQLKEILKTFLETADNNYTVIDCGTNSPDSVDYPDFAYAVARLVADGRAWRGIIIDGAGIGSCMAANKVPGVRAAMCYDQATAVNSREHNNANVLTLGAGLIGPNLAKQIVQTWLTTEFAGGRHARRVNKIEQIEKRFTK